MQERRPSPSPARSLALLPLVSATLGPALMLGVTAVAAEEGSWLYDFLLDRGWAQVLTLVLFFWAVGHLVRRALVHRAERAALRACADLVGQAPLERDGVPGLIESLRPFRGSLAGGTLGEILSYFRTHRPSRHEVWKVANHQIDVAHDAVEAEYRPLAAATWLIPLSGFLGTVLGMSLAIGSFEGIIARIGSDLGALAPAMKGLTVAFDTTLFALALVVPLKIIEVWQHRRDRALLDDLDARLGGGLVQQLDLAGLAQQSPEEQALDRYAETVDRIRGSLLAIDGLLHGLAERLDGGPSVGSVLSEIGAAARSIRDGIPAIRGDLQELRAHSEQPLVLVRQAGSNGHSERAAAAALP